MKKILLSLAAVVLGLGTASAMTPLTPAQLAEFQLQISTSNNAFAGTHTENLTYLDGNSSIRIDNWFGIMNQAGNDFGHVKMDVNWSSQTVSIPGIPVYNETWSETASGVTYNVYYYWVLCPSTVAGATDPQTMLAAALTGEIDEDGIYIDTPWSLVGMAYLEMPSGYEDYGGWKNIGSLFDYPVQSDFMRANATITADEWDVNNSGKGYLSNPGLEFPAYIDLLNPQQFYIYNLLGISTRPQYDVDPENPGNIFDSSPSGHQIIWKYYPDDNTAYSFRQYNWHLDHQGYLNAEDEHIFQIEDVYTSGLNTPGDEGYHKLNFGNVCFVDPETVMGGGFYANVVVNLTDDLDVLLPEPPGYPFGDVNHDYQVNVTDVNLIVSCVLAQGYEPDYDLNEDGVINVTDVNLDVSAALLFNQQ